MDFNPLRPFLSVFHTASSFHSFASSHTASSFFPRTFSSVFYLNVTCSYKILDNKRETTLYTDVTTCIIHTSMKQDGVSNEPVTFACHMCTYTLPCAHQKLIEKILEKISLLQSRRFKGLFHFVKIVSVWDVSDTC